MTSEKEVLILAKQVLNLIQTMEQLDSHAGKSPRHYEMDIYIRSWLASYLDKTHPDFAYKLTDKQRNALQRSFVNVLRKMSAS